MSRLIFLWSILFLVHPDLAAQQNQLEKKIKLPVYLSLENGALKDSIGTILSNLLREKGIKVIDEAEFKRLTALMYQKMFKEVNEQKSKGFEPDINKIQMKMPDYYQILSLKFIADPAGAQPILSQMTINIMYMPLKGKAINNSISDSAFVDKTLHEILERVTEIVIPSLK